MDPGLSKLWLLACKEVTKKCDLQGEENCFDLCPVQSKLRADLQQSMSAVSQCRKDAIWLLSVVSTSMQCASIRHEE